MLTATTVDDPADLDEMWLGVLGDFKLEPPKAADEFTEGEFRENYERMYGIKLSSATAYRMLQKGVASGAYAYRKPGKENFYRKVSPKATALIRRKNGNIGPVRNKPRRKVIRGKNKKKGQAER